MCQAIDQEWFAGSNPVCSVSASILADFFYLTQFMHPQNRCNVFLAQLVEHTTFNRRVAGSSPVEYTGYRFS